METVVVFCQTNKTNLYPVIVYRYELGIKSVQKSHSTINSVLVLGKMNAFREDKKLC